MDAIRRYDAMCAAFAAFDRTDEIQARKELEAAHVIGFSENLQVNSAFSVVRAFFEKLSRWEQEHNGALGQTARRGTTDAG